MSVFKKIDSNDNTITPFDVHKEFVLTATSYSSSFGAQILGATYHSYSFGDPIHGKPIQQELQNLNGTYKSTIYDSVNHLYYKSPNDPSKNFGGNLPEKEFRFLGEKAHVISIPSTIYDLRILSGSITFKDHYIETLPLDREKLIIDSLTVYNTPPLIANHWQFHNSQSGFVDRYGITTLTHATSSIPGYGAGVQVQTGSQAVAGTGSIMFKVHAYNTVAGTSYNIGNGLKLKPAADFTGSNITNWWTYQGGQAVGNKETHGMPVYNITMWVNPPDWNTMPNGVTGAPGQSTLITRDKNAYFELNMLTSSFNDHINNPKGLLPLQMFWGATSSNCTDSSVQEAIDNGLCLATGSWNLISVQQEFWPGDAYLGTSGSQFEQLPPWGHSPAKTTLRIFRPDPNDPRGYTTTEQVGYATHSIAPGIGTSHVWTNAVYRAVTSSIQYARNLYVGASGSYPIAAALSPNPGVSTKMNAFTGSMDDIRFYESPLTNTHLTTLYKHPYLRLDQIAPMTASFNLADDGYGNFRDKDIDLGSFAPSQSNLVGYYGFNELFTILNQVSKSTDILLHNGYGSTTVKDYSPYKNHGTSDKVKYTPGIAVFAQSGSNRSADSINYYQSSIPSGIRAQFNNSGSIKIPHHPKLNLGNPKGFAISFWVKIPENQIPGLNTIIRTEKYNTTGAGGNAGGTSVPCVNKISGSTAGRDYVTLITKTGLSNESILNNATGQYFIQPSNKGMNRVYPYNIELKNTHFQQAGQDIEYCETTKINTIVVRRSDGKNTIVLESKNSLSPLVDNHIIVEKTAGSQLNLYINGKLESTVRDTTGCTDNISDVFLGDDGLGWVTASNISHTFPYPVKPLSGSLDEVRFYNSSLSENQILSLYDNSWKASTAYQDNVVGNTFYEQGLLTLTNTNYPRYYSGSLHQGTATIGNNTVAIFSENFKLSLKNVRRIYEHKIKCHTKASDFNLSLNPTLLKPIIDECGNVTNSDQLKDFATKPEFNPYLTTIGLYDEFGRLLAIAKLARPIQKLQSVDMTFVVRFDR
jgi:hypothetical protein